MASLSALYYDIISNINRYILHVPTRTLFKNMDVGKYFHGLELKNVTVKVSPKWSKLSSIPKEFPGCLKESVAKTAVSDLKNKLQHELRGCPLRNSYSSLVKILKDVLLLCICKEFRRDEGTANGLVLADSEALVLLSLAAQLCAKYDFSKSNFIKYVLYEYLFQSFDITHVFAFLNQEDREGPGREFYPEPSTHVLYYSGENYALLNCESENALKYFEYYLTNFKELDILVKADGKFVKLTDADDGFVKQTHKYKYLTTIADYPFKPFTYWRDQDLVFTPLCLAVQVANQASVLLLLRFGARPIHPFSRQEDTSETSPLYILGEQIADIGESCPLDLILQEDAAAVASVDTLNTHLFRKLMECLRFMLRDQPFLPIRFEQAIVEDDDSEDSDTESSSDSDLEESKLPQFSRVVSETPLLSAEYKPRWLILDCRLQQLLPCCLSQPPPSLLRQCRHVIRRRLRGNRALPEGIARLGLPNLLQSFVDIKRD